MTEFLMSLGTHYIEKSTKTESILSGSYFARWKNSKRKLISWYFYIIKTKCSVLSYCALKKKSYFNYNFWTILENVSEFTCPIIYCRFRNLGWFWFISHHFPTIINSKNQSFFKYRNVTVWLFFMIFKSKLKCHIW